MPRVSFPRMMQDAERRGYAVGYFESWNLESLLAVADAAEAMQSPVILGFSGIALPNPGAGIRSTSSTTRPSGRPSATASPFPPACCSTSRRISTGLSRLHASGSGW